MRFIYYGHSCFAIETYEYKLLFDPFISGNELATHIDLNSLQPDYILLSHGHSDHTSDAVQLAKKNNSTIVACYEVAVWMHQQGIERYHPMNVGGRWNFDFGTVKCTSAIHSSSMPDGSYGGHAMGFVVNLQEGKFYYSGDTALTLDMQLLREGGPYQFIILPIGDNFTMGVEEAIQAAEWVGCKTVIGVHYDTFGYIKIDKEAAKKAFSDHGLQLLLPEIGESIYF